MATKIKSVVNFRDLGGLETQDGKTVKSGFFYRSGHLGKIKKKDIAKFEALGIKHVFDYRDCRERARHEDYKGNFEYYFVPAVANSADNPILPREVKEYLKDMGDEKYREGYELFTSTYLNLPFGNDAYKQTFDILDKGEPILFHCTAGKDRTGIFAMLILKALGVDEDSITENYLLSNKLRKKVNDRTVLLVKVVMRSKLATQFVKDVTYCDEDLFRSVMAKINEKYPNYNDFMLKEYGVTAERLENWKKMYLE